jgi:hypothetical protein
VCQNLIGTCIDPGLGDRKTAKEKAFSISK